MSILIVLGVAIATYVLIMVAFPKAAPEDKNANLKTALDRLYTETRNQENSPTEIARDQLSQESALVRLFFSIPFMRPLHQAAMQAGYAGDLKRILMFMVMTAAGVVLLGLVTHHLNAGLLVALPLAYFVPWRHCKKKIQARNRAFINQFPDALDMIVRSVRSGFPLSIALQMLSENAEEPVRGEFRQVVDDLALGRNLSQALARLAARINEPDIRFFVVVLSVQQETGGNLSEIISNLSNVIRKRKQLRHKIKAMTSEGKATGYVLGGLPVFVFAALWFLQPGYLDPFFTDPLGQMFFGGTLALIVTCFFVVKQMINIDI